MPYQSPVTIKAAIEKIQKQKYVLPSIQREFVWKPEQVEKLFDSLMRGYPINTFLFWNIEKENVREYPLYKFLKDFNERSRRHNTKLDLPNDESVIAILDGQQRLTSIYIGLLGTYAARKKYGKRDNPDAFPKKRLYLNLLKKADDEEKIDFDFDFRFLTDEEKENAGSEFHWFACGTILDFSDSGETIDYLDHHNLLDSSKYSDVERKFARKTLSEFFNVVHQKDVISYYLEDKTDLNRVLQVFIRTNSGGTFLSYSDLLLSIATAEWKTVDAREAIHEFVDELNAIGDGFQFTKDFVLKSCLVLADASNVKFDVNNFTRSNMEMIESKWEAISTSLRAAVKLISRFGYRHDNLTSLNAVIPIAYFVHFNECADKVISHSTHDENRKNIRHWLARVLLKGTFGGTPDSIYPIMREVIKTTAGRFDLQAIIERFRKHTKSIVFDSDDIESLLELEYGKSGTYCALTLLYPSLDYSEKYAQDHIHPKSEFHKTRMEKAGYSEEDIHDYRFEMNKIPNLELLSETLNHEKLATPFQDWVKDRYPVNDERDIFLQRHYIDIAQSLDFKDFMDFTERRREKLRIEFERILGVRE